MRGFATWIVAVWVAAWGGLALPSRACNVPVFRYALERWPADWYRLTIYHRGPLPAELEELAAALEKTGEDGFANLAVRRVNLDDASAKGARGRPDDLTDAELPAVVLQDSVQDGPASVVWKGPLSAGALAGLVDSPKRRELRKRLLSGDSAVWMLLESGDAAADARVEAMLREQSDLIAREFEIPEVDPSDPRTLGNTELRIGFSTLRLARNDPAEQFLLAQILHHHTQLGESMEPAVLPVFGRGRMLCSLRGEDLSPDTLLEVAAFLTGACSCEVKAMNPGVDLLIAADWDALIEGRVVEEPDLPPLVSLSGMAERMAAATAAATSAPPSGPGTAKATHPSPLRRNLTILGATALAVLAAGTIWLARRRPLS